MAIFARKISDREYVEAVRSRVYRSTGRRVLLGAIGLAIIAVASCGAMLLGEALRDTATNHGVATDGVYAVFGLAALLGLSVGLAFSKGVRLLLDVTVPDRSARLLIDLWDSKRN